MVLNEMGSKPGFDIFVFQRYRCIAVIFCVNLLKMNYRPHMITSIKDNTDKKMKIYAICRTQNR